jgi:SAM-dependent methyltransferase
MINPTEYAAGIKTAASRHDVSPHIHEDDFIFQFLASHPEWKEDLGAAIDYYFDDGARSCEMLRFLVSQYLPKESQLINILEFASGYGCVSRHLIREGRYDVTASDIHPAAMDFLALKLGMKTLQSSHIPEEFHCPSNFDVCFALSFFSHMPDATWSRWLNVLMKTVRPGGILIFTTHGLTSAAKYFDSPKLCDAGFWFKPESEQVDLDAAEYGQTVVTPRYVFRKLSKIQEALPILFQPGYWWEHQDIYVVKRAEKAGRTEHALIAALLQDTHAEIQYELAEARHELAEARHRLVMAEAQYRTVLQRVTALESSTSWRITAPLRALVHTLRRIRSVEP